MIASHMSPAIHLRMEDGRTVKFKTKFRDEFVKPDPEKCKGKITGVFLSYAFCGEQDFGIEPLAESFGASEKNDWIMKNTPVSIAEFKGIKAIMAGIDYPFNAEIIQMVKKAGLMGCWDDESFAIFADSDYSFVIDEIAQLIKPNRTKFAFSNCFMGRQNLLILEV